MGWIRTVLSEIWGLFVDDVSLVVAALVWLVAIFFAARLHMLPPQALGPALFAGLAVIFVENTLRRARN
jgi:hypothetical protein